MKLLMELMDIGDKLFAASAILSGIVIIRLIIDKPVTPDVLYIPAGYLAGAFLVFTYRRLRRSR